MSFVVDVGWSRVRVARVGEDSTVLEVREADAGASMDEVLEQVVRMLTSLGCGAGSRVAVGWNGVVRERREVRSARGGADVSAWLEAKTGADVQVWNDAHAAGWCVVRELGVRTGVIAVIGSSLGRAFVQDGVVVETAGAGELLEVLGCSCGEAQCVRSLPGGVRFAEHVARARGAWCSNEELRAAWERGEESVRGVLAEAFFELWARLRVSVFEPAVLVGCDVFVAGSFGVAWFDEITEAWERDAAMLDAIGARVPECVAVEDGAFAVLRGLAYLVSDDQRWR